MCDGGSTGTTGQRVFFGYELPNSDCQCRVDLQTLPCGGPLLAAARRHSGRGLVFLQLPRFITRAIRAESSVQHDVRTQQQSGRHRRLRNVEEAVLGESRPAASST